jgi:hypothetical protein
MGKSQKIATLQQMYSNSNALLHPGIEIRALFHINLVTVNMKRSTDAGSSNFEMTLHIFSQVSKTATTEAACVNWVTGSNPMHGTNSHFFCV